MSVTPRPGMLRFDGDVAVFYMTISKECDSAMPHPDEATQKRWAEGHRQTGHPVMLAVDVQPDPNITGLKRMQMIARLREKHSKPMTHGYGGNCAGHGKTCHGHIAPGQRYVQWDGKLWHAECLDDSAYLRMASISDIAPGVFADVKPITTYAWVEGNDWARANPSYRLYDSGPQTVIADPMARHAGLVAAIGVNVRKIIAANVDANVDEQPKKPNARERRRQRRKDKQWRRGS